MTQEDTTPAVKICRDCGDQIVWLPTNDNRTNRWGEPLHLPYNFPDTATFHRCKEYMERLASQYQSLPSRDKSKGIPCKVCNNPIMFSEEQRSPISGKMIPLELTGEPHRHITRAQASQYGHTERYQVDAVFQHQGSRPENELGGTDWD